MGRVAGELARLAEQVLRKRDPELAADLGPRDDELDDLHLRLLTLIQDPSWPGSIPAAVGRGAIFWLPKNSWRSSLFRFTWTRSGSGVGAAAAGVGEHCGLGAVGVAQNRSADHR
jgi:hypothetical protein